MPIVRRHLAVACALAAALLGCRSTARATPTPSPPSAVAALDAPSSSREIVAFPSGELTLHGILYTPDGSGPFPAVVYNHGSAGGMVSVSAADALGPVFAARGWVFFMPSRRGQGLSADAGPYIMDEINTARDRSGPLAAEATLVRLLETDHLDDQLAALAWLRARSSVDPARVAVAGTSFGGIETVLGAERASYCAAVDSAGAAQTWASMPALRDRLTRAVQNAQAPIFFFQAENDYDLTPSRALAAAMKGAGRPFEIEIFPAYGASVQDGHAFGYFGSAVWGEHVFRFLDAHCGARAKGG